MNVKLNQKYTEKDLRNDLLNKEEYKFGWESNLEYEIFPIGLNEEIVEMISLKKNEPQ